MHGTTVFCTCLIVSLCSKYVGRLTLVQGTDLGCFGIFQDTLRVAFDILQFSACSHIQMRTMVLEYVPTKLGGFYVGFIFQHHGSHLGWVFET